MIEVSIPFCIIKIPNQKGKNELVMLTIRIYTGMLGFDTGTFFLFKLILEKNHDIFPILHGQFCV